MHLQTSTILKQVVEILAVFLGYMKTNPAMSVYKSHKRDLAMRRGILAALQIKLGFQAVIASSTYTVSC